MKICFASDVHYPNYTKRIQEATLKCFLDTELYEYDIHYYISTNRPKDLEHYNNVNNVKVFDINELRSKNVVSQKFELLPDNPVGIYPGKYPWNLRRFVIEKAAKVEFDYIIYVDADTILNGNITGEQIVNELKSKYQENKVKSNAAIFEYEENSTAEHFAQHKKYFEILDMTFQKNELKTLDGPCMVFMGKTNKDILNLVDVWHKFTDFGYQKELGFGYGNNFHGNLSFAIPISGFEVLHEQFPFYPNHVFEDRYTHDYKHHENQEVEKNEIKEKFQFNIKVKNTLNDLNEINRVEPEIKLHDISFFFEKYSTKKYSNGFSQIFENYFKEIKTTHPSILEIGVGTVSLEPPEGRNHVPENMYYWKEQNPNYQPGNSLRAMRDYIGGCELYGIDIQKDCLINEGNIKTSIFDSRNPKKSQEFINDKRFDLIIDDSDKDVNIRIITFNNFYSSIKDNGYYVIEGLLESHFLSEYLNHYGISHKIIGDFMIISKNNNFSVFKNTNESNINFENPHFSEIKEDINYEKLINTTPRFSILNQKLADKGFYVNLKKSIERKENVEKQIEEFDIKGLIRFGALTDEMIQYSCTKSHLSVFRNALENNLETIFVAEDDFQINDELYLPNSNPIYFSDKIGKIKNDLDSLEWDVFLFGCNPKSQITPITENVGLINKSTGAWAYLIKKRAYVYLLNNLNYKRDYIAIDDYLPMLSDVGFRTLTAIPLTIGHAVGYSSTLQPKGPVNYTDWILGNYHKFLFDIYPNNSFLENSINKNN